MHDQEVHACEKLKTELSSSEAQKDKASTLLADRTDWFSTALAKKNLSLSRSKITTHKLKAEVDGVKAAKQAAVNALKTEVESSVEAEKDKQAEDVKRAGRTGEELLHKLS